VDIPIVAATAAFVVVVVIIVVYLSVRVVRQGYMMVVYRLGQARAEWIRGPGLNFLVPFIWAAKIVDVREQFIEVPSQTTITKDNAPINVDFLIYWRISDPLKSVVNVVNFPGALQGVATTTLRAVIGDILLDEVLSKREQINEVLRVKLDEVTERWGGKVTTVEIREITPPRDVQDAMNRQLSAERTRRAPRRGKRRPLHRAPANCRIWRTAAERQPTSRSSTPSGRRERTTRRITPGTRRGAGD